VLTLQLLATLAAVQVSYLVGCLLAAHISARAKIHSGGKQMIKGLREQGRVDEWFGTVEVLSRGKHRPAAVEVDAITEPSRLSRVLRRVFDE
jgi:hypothetical protein